MVFADLNEIGAQESAEKSKTMATNPSYKAMALKLDITKKSSVQQVVDTALKEFGRIDYGVHCAGVCISHLSLLSLRP